MGWFSDDIGTPRSNEDCTENNCEGTKLVGQQGQHYRYQCGSDSTEGYGNTDGEKSGGGQGLLGKVWDSLFSGGGW